MERGPAWKQNQPQVDGLGRADTASVSPPVTGVGWPPKPLPAPQRILGISIPSPPIGPASGVRITWGAL